MNVDKAPTGPMRLQTQKIRADFPILRRTVNDHPLIYMDNAATSQKPGSVIDAVSDFYSTSCANIHRAVHTLSYEATLAYDEAHRKVARFIGAEDWRNVVFTRNATEAINMVAYGWALHHLGPGDEIVVSIMEHHSNIVPWQMICEMTGAELSFIDIDDEGGLRLDTLDEVITKKTALVGIVHVSNVLGVVNPVKMIVERAHEVGAVALVDAAQSIPHIAVDVGDIGCDFLAATGHKMLGPTGTGFLYATPEMFAQMRPFNYGGDMIETVTEQTATWNELPWKFEAGTPNIAGGIGLAAAVDYLEALGMKNVHAHESELFSHALAALSGIPWLELYGPTDPDRIGVISFNIEGVHPHDVAGFLDERGIAVRSGHHCTQPLMKRMGIENAVRASFYIYNTTEEIDTMTEALDKVHALFSR